jgi:hypothetical protein
MERGQKINATLRPFYSRERETIAIVQETW